MATRKIVPRADDEGGIGTALKKWASGWIKLLTVTTINALTLTAQTIGFTIAGGTTSKTLTVEGDSVVGSDLSPDAGPTFDHLHLTSGQIGFPATQVPSADPNTQDDYEKGGWIPGLSFGGGTTGITYSTNSGFYTKIGNMVIISGRIILTSNGSSTGPALITGLPFTVINDPAAYAAILLWLRYITFANQFQGRVAPNATTVDLQELTEAGALSDLADTDFSDNTQVVIGASYRVA